MSEPDVAALEPADRDRLAEALDRGYGVPAKALDPWNLWSPEDAPSVYATRADPADVPAQAVRAGVRLGAWDGDDFRLSIEGADLLEHHLDEVLDVGEEHAKAWLVGDDVPAPPDHDRPYLVLRWEAKGWVLGAGPVRDGVVENHLHRGRRIAHPRWEEGRRDGTEPPVGADGDPN